MRIFRVYHYCRAGKFWCSVYVFFRICLLNNWFVSGFWMIISRSRLKLFSWSPEIYVAASWNDSTKSIPPYDYISKLVRNDDGCRSPRVGIEDYETVAGFFRQLNNIIWGLDRIFPDLPPTYYRSEVSFAVQLSKLCIIGHSEGYSSYSQ